MLTVRYAALAAAATLFVTLAGGVAAQEKTATPGATQPMQQTKELRRALHTLYSAGRQLMRAPQDQAGHRDKALDLVKQAQAELRAALPPRQGGRGVPGKAPASPPDKPPAGQ